MTGLSSDKIIESMVVSENAVSADARFSEDEDGLFLTSFRTRMRSLPTAGSRPSLSK